MSRVTTEFTALTYVTSGSHIKVGSYWVNNWGLFLLNPGMIKVLIVKSILLLEESLHRVTDPGSQSTPLTHLVRVVVLFRRL